MRFAGGIGAGAPAEGGREGWRKDREGGREGEREGGREKPDQQHEGWPVVGTIAGEDFCDDAVDEF